MRLISLLIAAWLAAGGASAPVSAQELSPQEKQVLMQQYYQKAFELYSSGEYGRAVEAWTEVLKLDRYQTTASDMIEDARKRIAERNERREKEVQGLVARGEYEAAGLLVEKLLGDDPTHPRYRALRAKLARIARHVPSARDQGKATVFVRKALAAYLSPEQDYQFAYDALRYARDLEPQSKRIAGLIGEFEDENRDLVRYDKLTPGMTFMEFKHAVALDQIYDGKYQAAVETCDEILALEPSDLTALKRLGSAYYALGLKGKARLAWERAMKVAPQDEQLSRFLARVPKTEEAAASGKAPPPPVEKP